MRQLVLLLTLAIATAGCTFGDEETPTPTPTDDVVATPTSATPIATPTVTPTEPTPEPPLDSSSYRLAAAGIPAQAKLGARWNFTLFVNGSLTRPSTHIGAHFANNDTTDPPVVPGRRDCEHVAGDLPGVFTAACRMNETGTWYVWGHAQINDSGELRNWWASPPAIVKVRDYNLTLSGVPTAPISSNQTFSFSVASVGSENVTTHHFGAHFWNASTEQPTIQNATGACEHLAVGAVGNYTITCAIANREPLPQGFFLRGHLLLAEGATVLEWWSAETTITVLGNPLI